MAQTRKAPSPGPAAPRDPKAIWTDEEITGASLGVSMAVSRRQLTLQTPHSWITDGVDDGLDEDDDFLKTPTCGPPLPCLHL